MHRQGAPHGIHRGHLPGTGIGGPRGAREGGVGISDLKARLMEEHRQQKQRAGQRRRRLTPPTSPASRSKCIASTGPPTMEDVLNATLTQEKLQNICKTRDLNKVTKLELCIDMNSMDVESLGNLLPSLETLILDGSALSSFRDLGTGLSHLCTLSIAHARVADLDGIGALRGLRELHLRHNELEDLTPLAFHEALQVLDVSHNKIASLGELAVLGSCPLLHSLDLRGNPLDLSLEDHLRGSQGRRIVYSMAPQLRELNGRGLSGIELKGASDTDIHDAMEILQGLSDPTRAEGSSAGLYAREGGGGLEIYGSGGSRAQEGEPLPGYDSELTAGPVALTGNPIVALRRRRLDEGRLKLGDSAAHTQVADLFNNVDEATADRWRLELETDPEEQNWTAPTCLTPSANALSPVSPCVAVDKERDVKLPSRLMSFDRGSRPKSAIHVPRPVMVARGLPNASQVSPRRPSLGGWVVTDNHSEESDSEGDEIISASSTRAAIKLRAKQASVKIGSTAAPLSLGEAQDGRGSSGNENKRLGNATGGRCVESSKNDPAPRSYWPSRRRSTCFMDVEKSLQAVETFASSATDEEDMYFFHREDVETDIMDTASGRGGDPSLWGDASEMDDRDIIVMLQQPLREVPQLRTREKFQTFFRAMNPGRLDQLLHDAFDHSDCDPEEAQRKISHRKSIMAQAALLPGAKAGLDSGVNSLIRASAAPACS